MNRGSRETLAKGDQDGAIADFTRAIELSPTMIMRPMRVAADPRNSKGDHDGGIADFTRAIELNPKYADAYQGRGYALQERKGRSRRGAC